MARRGKSGSQPNVPAVRAAPNKGDGGAPPRLHGLDSNPQGHFGPRFWQAFRETVVHLYTVSLADPSDQERFTLATRTYPMPAAVLMRTQGTGFIMKRSPAQVARGADQLLIFLQTEGSVRTDCAGRRGHLEAGDVAIFDYARPLHNAATDYGNLMIVLARESAPTALLVLEPHGLIFPRGSGAAHLIGAALRELYGRADDLTVSEAEAAIEGIVALTTACARLSLGDERERLKSRRKVALDYIDAHLGNARLGPDAIADAASLSRASLYRLLAAEGGIRAVLLKRRLDQAVRLMLADNKDEYSLKEIANCCGFGGTSQFNRAFRARFGVPPRQYRSLVRQQDLEWHEARLIADGFDQDTFLWRQRELGGPRQSSGPD